MKPLHKRILSKLSQEIWALPPDFLRLIHEIASERIEISADDAAKLRLMSEKTANGPMVSVVVEPVGDRPGLLRAGDVGLMSITGPIMRYADFFTDMSGATTLEDIVADFSALEADPRVNRIIQIYDTPGGQATGVLEAADLFARGEKPLVAYVEGMAASAGYALAAAADSIVIGPMAEVGSVGVAAMVRTEKPKGRAEFVSSQTPRKRPDATTDAGRQEIQSRVDELGDEFIRAVATMRGASFDRVAGWEGGVANGDRALELGMADGRGVLIDLVQNTGGPMAKAENITVTVDADAAKAAIEDQAKLIEERVVAAVKQERDRIGSALAQADPQLEARLGAAVWALVWDGTSTDGDVAKAVLAAERERADAVGTPPPALSLVPAKDPATGPKKADAAKTPEQQWGSDPKLQAQFPSAKHYAVWLQKNQAGLIK